MTREDPQKDYLTRLAEQEQIKRYIDIILDNAPSRPDEEEFRSAYKKGFREYDIEQDKGVTKIKLDKFKEEQKDLKPEKIRMYKENKRRGDALEIFVVQGRRKIRILRFSRQIRKHDLK